MRLGIDFGTTRVVVAAVDRGNYPILSFETPEGPMDWFPPMVASGARNAATDGRPGRARQSPAEPGWTLVRSLKRMLEDAASETALEVDGTCQPSLGGGTFNASLVELDETVHTVVASEGIATLGGDDFDHVLAELAVGETALAELSVGELFRLLEEMPAAEGSVPPQRAQDRRRPGPRPGGLGGRLRSPTEAFHERCRPLVEETIRRVAELVGDDPIEALYVTGGGSELPQILREAFGRRVRRRALHPLGDCHRPRHPGRRRLGLRAPGRVCPELRGVARG